MRAIARGQFPVQLALHAFRRTGVPGQQIIGNRYHEQGEEGRRQDAGKDHGTDDRACLRTGTG